MLSQDTATTVFGEISKYVWNFVRNRWVHEIVTKTSSTWPPMPMLRKGNVKNWYNHQHDTIAITAFPLCHNTQQKDTQFLNVLCVHKTQQKVLNSLFLMTSLDVFLFHSTICTKFCCKNLLMDFSQQMIILNLSFVLSWIGKHSFQKTRSPETKIDR